MMNFGPHKLITSGPERGLVFYTREGAAYFLDLHARANEAIRWQIFETFKDAYDDTKLAVYVEIDPDNDLADAIREFRAALPGWWFTTGECSVSADASCGPDVAHTAEPVLTKFDAGFHEDQPQPATMAAALRSVTAKALAALKEMEGDAA